MAPSTRSGRTASLAAKASRACDIACFAVIRGSRVPRSRPAPGSPKDTSPSSGGNAGGDPFQGTQNHDVTVLRVDLDVPAQSDCLTLNYRFLSEEFSEYIGKGFNDTFILQLDRYDWSAGVALSAPGNFASDGQPIVLGPEHPTTGGYPVIGVIASAELGRFHEIRLGGCVRFTLTASRFTVTASR